MTRILRYTEIYRVEGNGDFIVKPHDRFPYDSPVNGLIQTKKLKVNLNLRQDLHNYQLSSKRIQALYYM